MKAVESGSQSSINVLGEGKWIQLRAETVDRGSTDGFGCKPIVFPKDVRPYHCEEIASVVHNAVFFDHTGNNAEDAAIIRERYRRSLSRTSDMQLLSAISPIVNAMRSGQKPEVSLSLARRAFVRIDSAAD